MTAVALILPGQGSETAGMGLELAKEDAHAASLLDRASACTGTDARAVLERGGALLDRTDFLQPLLTAVSVAAARVLVERTGPPAWVAGHSLGEIGALAVAGALGDADAVELAAVRGRIMAREAARNPGSMVAVFVENERTIHESLAAAGLGDQVAVAAHNAPDEWALSGPASALREIARRLPSRALAVSGAWHGPAMRDGVEELRVAVRAALRGPPRVPIVCNRTAEVVRDPSLLPDLLAEQLVQPVLWTETLRRLRALGAERFVIAGPGRIQRALVRRTLGRAVPVDVTDRPSDIARATGTPP